MCDLDFLIDRIRDTDGIALLLRSYRPVQDHQQHMETPGWQQGARRVPMLLGIVAPDKTGRFGGEEFLVILDCGRRDIAVIARAIIDFAPKIREIPQPSTANAGLAILHPADTTTPPITRADAALYRIKR